MENNTTNFLDESILVRPYKNLKNTNTPNLERKIDQYYDLVFDTIVPWHITPRYMLESGLKIGMKDIFYYIDMLYEKNPATIIDVGCGECTWKRWFPRIIGFDPNTGPYYQQDFVDYFDEDFSRGHEKKFDCGLAINSLHFIPWRKIPDQIDLAMNIVRDRFLFTFNFDKFHKKPDISDHELILELKTMLEHTPYEVLMFDCPFYRGYSFQDTANSLAFINGSVRFILAHQSNI